MDATPPKDLLTPGEVAGYFRVDPKTVTRWANAGKIDAVRTLGGHRRFRRDQVAQLMRESGIDPARLDREAG
ncbi:BldC family transcriptional regulator [Georgenia sp. Z1491]|uniref:BldC family transcriptional regulator n=1 Tax=Georgenia sp. Z1491 TaxID=3416707 RepID=UPI003CEB1011